MKPIDQIYLTKSQFQDKAGFNHQLTMIKTELQLSYYDKKTFKTDFTLVGIGAFC